MLETLASRAYHLRMDLKVTKARTRTNGTKLTTTTGVVGYVAPDVPTAALEGLRGKLLAKTVEPKHLGSSNAHVTTFDAGCNPKVTVSD